MVRRYRVSRPARRGGAGEDPGKSREAKGKRPAAGGGYTLVELMVVLALIAIVGAIAYPTVTDTLRRARARDGAKAVVNAVVSARAQAMIRNLAYRITLTTSNTTGERAADGGGSVVVERASGASCTAAGTVFFPVEQYLFSSLRDVNLCIVRTSPSPLVDHTSSCVVGTTTLCVTPDGVVTNLAEPNAANTIAYIREYTPEGNAVGVVRQVVIPRRKTVQVNPVQVTNEVCL